MKDESTLRALVVDDEAMMRQATMRALSKIGFACEAATNGREALECCFSSDYDVVVTDLRMPDMNGHALAVELLQLPRRPVVAVLTGVVEPRLAKDLLARGVDEIAYKPVDFSVFAANVHVLVVNRTAQLRGVRQGAADTTSEASHPAAAEAGNDTDSSRIADIVRAISDIAAKLPPPPPSFDAFKQLSANAFESKDLAIAMGAHPSIAVELLRLTNSFLYSHNQQIKDNETNPANDK